jgi:hypothetical protein
LLRAEGQLYNLLGDPCLALNLPQALPLRVEKAGARQLRLSGPVPPGAVQLWIEYFDLSRFRANAPVDATDEQRRQLFQEVNQAPRLLAQQALTGSSWQVEVSLTDAQMGHGSKIRVMAFGGGSVYAHTISMPLPNSEGR